MLREITINDFIYNYDPISDSISDAIMLGTDHQNLANVQLMFKDNPMKVWTLVEKNGQEIIVPGMLIGQEIGFFICNIARDDDDIVVSLAQGGVE